jgi:hypothetical protein
MREAGEWAMIALFCVTVIAGAVVGAALRSGMAASGAPDQVYMASSGLR